MKTNTNGNVVEILEVSNASKVRAAILSDFRDKEFTVRDLMGAASTPENATSAFVSRLAARGALEVPRQVGHRFFYRVVDTAMIEAITSKGSRVGYSSEQPPKRRFKQRLVANKSRLTKEPLNHHDGDTAQRVRDIILREFVDARFPVVDIADALGIMADKSIKPVGAAMSNLLTSGALEKIGETKNHAFILKVANAALIKQPIPRQTPARAPRLSAEFIDELNDKTYLEPPNREYEETEHAIDQSKLREHLKVETSAAPLLVNELIDLAICIEHEGMTRTACITLIELAAKAMKQI